MNQKINIVKKTALLSAWILGAAQLTTGAFAADPQIPKHDGKPADMSKPVQVYILMGQSNMTGMGKMETLHKAVKEKNKYPYLLDADGKWTVRSDVQFARVHLVENKRRNGWLGTFLNDRPNPIGVEYGIGHVLGNATDAPVLLIKSCNGNRSLGWHLLPPGSTRFEFGDKVYAGYGEGPASWPKGTEPPPYKLNKDLTKELRGDSRNDWYGGRQYDIDVHYAKKTLEEIGTYYPGAKSYEVAGFFFWQGEKDAGTPAYADRYETNLVQLIKSLRKDFNAPNAKFVLGTIGEADKGKIGNATGNFVNTTKILEAHLAVSDPAKHPEFKGNVATVYTHDMVQGGSGNGHYGENAEVYMDVGEAMGQAIIGLLKK
jgi:hypothetical protein